MPTIPWLSSQARAFPPLEHALEFPNGLLAAGGDLSAERLLEAYTHGIFPWYEAPDPILWWSPDPRAVIEPARLHLSASLRKLLRRSPFSIRADSAFRRVIEACAAPRSVESGTWIGADMREAYCELHRLGYAHCVEAWQGNELVGGLYGVAIGRVFFGESMFSRADNASKIAFAYLARQLQAWDFALIDCQQDTAHMRTFGAHTIARREFRDILEVNVNLPGPDSPWQFDWSDGESPWATR